MKKLMALIYKDIIQMKFSLIMNLLLDMLFIVISIFALVEFRQTPPEGMDVGSIDYAFEFCTQVISFMLVAIITPYSLVMNSVSIDEKSQFTKFILASGGSRSLIVNQKALFGFFASIPSFIYMIAMPIFLLTSGNEFLNAGFAFGIMIYGILSILFRNSLSILYSSIFSSISNQAIGVIIFMIVGGLLYGGIYLGMSFLGTNNALYFFYGVAGALIALIVGCHFAAIKIYQHKDF